MTALLAGVALVALGTVSVHHACYHTLTMGTAIKLIENHLGRRFVQHGGQLVQPQG